MARNRDPFTQALSALRERIQTGAIPGGAPVIVVDEAERLSLSTTPVREALARLSGEGLVVRAAPGGYFAMPFDASDVSERYAMRGRYLRMAVEISVARLGALTRPAPRFDEGAPESSVHRLFRRLVIDTGHAYLGRSYDHLAGQLNRTRLVETRLFANLRAEGEALFDAYSHRSTTEFLDCIDEYHQRRLDAAASLASMLNDPDGD